MPTSFLEILRRAIAADGRSQYRLAKDSGVDVAILQRLMANERGVNLTTAEKICRQVGLELQLKRGRKGMK